MRRFLMILLLLAVSAGNISIYAQAITGKEREREVKTSGDYYYGEGVDTDQSRSKKSALDDLKLMILEAAMSSNTNLKTADFNGFGDNIPFEVFDLEGRTKVLMYVAKSDLDIEMISSQKARVICRAQVSSPAESSYVASGEQPIEVPVATPAKIESESKLITITINKPELQSSQAEPEPVQQPAATPPSQSTYASNNTHMATRPEARQPMRTSEPIINQLLSIRQYEEARQLLNKYKLNGKLMYGQLATLSNPQNCYFLVLRNREIIDILDKSDRSERRSLITGNVTDYRTTSGVVLWVCIL